MTRSGAASSLDRFVTAQQGDWEQARAELQRGRKTGHWIWYVLPQLRGLGMSSTSQHYGLSGLDEARAYAAHPVLGARLREAASIIVASPTPTAEQLMGGIDAMKLRSSMTLFREAAPEEPVFQQVLDRYYDGEADARTLQMLGRG